MPGRQRSPWIDYSIEEAGGKFRVRLRSADGRERVEEFPTKSGAREFVQRLRRWPGDEPAPR
jgi:hypothetical protein